MSKTALSRAHDDSEQRHTAARVSLMNFIMMMYLYLWFQAGCQSCSRSMASLIPLALSRVS